MLDARAECPEPPLHTKSRRMWSSVCNHCPTTHTYCGYKATATQRPPHTSTTMLLTNRPPSNQPTSIEQSTTCHADEGEANAASSEGGDMGDAKAGGEQQMATTQKDGLPAGTFLRNLLVAGSHRHSSSQPQSGSSGSSTAAALATAPSRVMPRGAVEWAEARLARSAGAVAAAGAGHASSSARSKLNTHLQQHPAGSVSGSSSTSAKGSASSANEPQVQAAWDDVHVGMNESQEAAIATAFKYRMSLIQGPPGRV